MNSDNFPSLYEYSTPSGIVVPQISSVKESVEAYFKQVFGNDFSVDPETPQGRIIEALTLLFVDTLRVTAVNANSFNPQQAVGAYLDHLGKMFGISRSTQSDEQFRQQIVNGQSRTNGYPQSIMNAVSNVSGVGAVCVLENGYSYPVVLPNNETGIAVAPHTIFVSVGDDGSSEGYSDDAVAQAIYATKSAGCGYTDTAEYGTLVTRTVTDATTGSVNTVKFYRAQSKTVSVTVSIRNRKYTGIDIIADTKAIISTLINSKPGGSTLSTIDISNALIDSEIGVYATSVSMSVGGSQVSSVTIRPYEELDADAITVNLL